MSEINAAQNTPHPNIFYRIGHYFAQLNLYNDEVSLVDHRTTHCYSSEFEFLSHFSLYSHADARFNSTSTIHYYYFTISVSVRTINQSISIDIVMSMFTSSHPSQYISLILSQIPSSVLKWIHISSMDLLLVLLRCQSISSPGFSH